ncbi:phenylalanine-tRNA ligase, beta subunit [Anncaliia algerae PRA339]|uniref:phenylalanine--tRNA ligase n=1 Tax=Anncaliia algerae PRA339 TaxID=1288291 RepID=A0A059F0S2_9MICR|nr:phenylalanine-tRNA ligase, beta subunit [Anncaliia algerae PRA339]
MPSVTIKKAELPNLHNIEDILFDFGLETEETPEGLKIDCPANRYDLLTPKGLLSSLDCFLNCREYEEIKINQSNYQINAESTIRPVISGAVIHFTEEICYNELINYQEKLHDTIGRDRKLLALGIHDYFKVSFPLTYKDVNINDFKFNPLNCEETYSFTEFMNFLEKSKCMKYLKVTNQKLPAILDKNNKIISLPPVLNSNFTKITEKTKSIFIDITGNDKVKVENVLKLFLYNFRGKIEEVKVNGQSLTMNNYSFVINLEEVNKFMGIQLTTSELQNHLTKMMHSSRLIGEGEFIDKNNVVNYENFDRKKTNLLVKVSDVRFDVMEKCDLLEDICISYGFNNISKSLNISFSCGQELPFNRFTDKIREEMAQSSFTETLNLVLNSTTGIKTNLILNSVDKLHLRLDLFRGMLSNIHFNKRQSKPIKIFEVGDVILGWENKRLLAFMVADKEDCIDLVQGVLYLLIKHVKKSSILTYKEREYADFIKQRSVDCFVDGILIGRLGILSGDLCNKHKVDLVCTAVEIDLEVLFNIFMNKN